MDVKEFIASLMLLGFQNTTARAMLTHGEEFTWNSPRMVFTGIRVRISWGMNNHHMQFRFGGSINVLTFPKTLHPRKDLLYLGDIEDQCTLALADVVELVEALS